jgi:cold shock protein
MSEVAYIEPDEEMIRAGAAVLMEHFELSDSAEAERLAGIIYRAMAVVCEPQTCTGRVKWFNKDKGWGFITFNGGTHAYTGDVFFHQKNVRGMPASGVIKNDTPVSFVVVRTDRGPKARVVEIMA